MVQFNSGITPSYKKNPAFSQPSKDLTVETHPHHHASSDPPTQATDRWARVHASPIQWPRARCGGLLRGHSSHVGGFARISPPPFPLHWQVGPTCGTTRCRWNPLSAGQSFTGGAAIITATPKMYCPQVVRVYCRLARQARHSFISTLFFILLQKSKFQFSQNVIFCWGPSVKKAPKYSARRDREREKNGRE